MRRSYRQSMAEFSQIKTLELWYTALWAEDLIATIKDPELRRRAIKRIEKERAKSAGEEIFPKLVEQKGDIPVIKDQLPTIFHVEGHTPGEVHDLVMDAFSGYRDSLPASLQSLLDRYELRDAAPKVVGVGSVGTACFVLLSWPARPILSSPGERGPHLGAGAFRGCERIFQPRPAGSERLPADAARQRHVPRLDHGRMGVTFSFAN